MKSNVRNIWSYAALLMGFLALLPAVVGCNASEDDVVTVETPSAPQPLNVRFRVLMHENGKKTINKDAIDHEDYVEKVVLLGKGKAGSVKATGDYGTATWVVSKGQVATTAGTWYFVANCVDGDVPSITNAPSLAGITLNTSNYLRRYGALGAETAMLMTATVEQGAFPVADAATGTRTLDKDVTFKRVFARFSYQTYPLPAGYVIKKVTVERIPDKFMLNGDKPSGVGQLNNLVLWDGDLGNDQPFAKWKRSPWQSPFTPDPDMYLSGHFYLPPCKLDNSTDVFGTNQRGNMPVMRFVFTDNQNRTFVRLYRLGDSTTNAGKGNIGVNKHYDVRINLLGPYQERADNDEDLKLLDEDAHKVKAAFVN